MVPYNFEAESRDHASRSTAACVAVAELVAAMLQREDGLISGTGIAKA